MTDFAGFKHGGVTFPLPAMDQGLGGEGAAFLRDADPFVFFALEFFSRVLEIHIGTRFMQQAAAAGLQGTSHEDIESVVGMVVPFNPAPYLTEGHFRFPLLAIWRERGVFEYVGQRKIAVEQVNVSWVLPPLDQAQAEKLWPVLKAVCAILDNRSEQGFDPEYVPSGAEPPPANGTPHVVWSADFAGLKSVEMKSYEYGGFTPTEDLFYPAVVMKFEVKERSEALVSELLPLTGVDQSTGLLDEDGSVVEDVVTGNTYEPHTLVSVSPSSGSKSGNTPVAITGTGFRSGRQYRVLFGSACAASVRVESETELTCLTPQYAAYPTAAVNVRVIDDLGNTASLPGAFTFTTP